MVAIQGTKLHLILWGLGLIAYLVGRGRSVTRDTGLLEDEVARSEQLQLGSGGTGVQRAKYRKGLGIRAGVKADAFVKALREGRWEQVTTERDYERIAETFQTAVERNAAWFLIGFALPGHPTRVVWVDVQVIPAGFLSPVELLPNLPPGTKRSTCECLVSRSWRTRTQRPANCDRTDSPSGRGS